MRACIELSRDHGWGPTRILADDLERGGYRVAEVRSPRHVLLALSGPAAAGDGALALLPAAGAPTPDGVTAGMPERTYATLPVLPALAPLLPGAGLGKGEVVAVERAGALSAALAAGASQAGLWWGVAGIPEFGVAAAAGMGADPARMMLVPEPGPKWAEVAAAMLEACEVVLLRPRGSVTGALRRRAWLWLPGPDGTITAAGVPAARRPQAAPAAGLPASG